MRKFLIIASVLGLFLSMSAESVFAGANIDERGRISVNTSASAEIEPNLAEISFAVKTSDIKSLERAGSMNKEISDKLYSVLNSLIDTKNGDYIKTSGYSANPVYSYINSKKNFERYEVSNNVIVHTKSIENVGKIIDLAIKSGATNVDNLSFTLSDYETQCNDLIFSATQKAKQRASFVAKALDTNLAGISNISSTCSLNNYNVPKLYMAKNMISDTASESTAGSFTSISSGTVKLNANVNASFYVK